jgi:hypothetical protein
LAQLPGECDRKTSRSYIAKPIDIDGLPRTVAEHLARRRERMRAR